MKDKENSLSYIVLNHFDMYQREGYQSSLKKSRHSVSVKNNGSAEARVANIREDISLHLLNNAVGDISINGNDNGGRNESAQPEILEAVLKVVDVAMVTELGNDNEESNDRILDLVASFSCCADYIYMAESVVDRAIQFSGVVSEQIRSQACKLLGLCVEKLRISGECTDQLEPAKEALLLRVTDKSQAVRNSAIKACGSFFVGSCDTEEQEYGDVKIALLWSMDHDPSLANRSAAIWSVPLSDEQSIDKVIARVRDVKSKVRVEALEAIRTKANIMIFSQEQLASVLRSGLTERCNSTQEAAMKVVCTTWMKSVKFDPVALIELVGPTVYEKECEKMVRTILSVASDDKKDILTDFSDPERRAFRDNVEKASSLHRQKPKATESMLDVAQVLFARVSCEHAETLSGMKKAGIVAKVIPDIPELCEMFQQQLSALVESINARDADEDETEAQSADDLEDRICFVCVQLLNLAKISGLEEEGSRRHFIAVMKDVLASLDTPDDLLEGCIQAIASAHENESYFLQTVSEILADLSDDTSEEETDMKDLEICQHLRIVSILSIVLENVSPHIATSPILQNFTGYILPSITSTNSMVRECGVSTLGRYALLSKEDIVMEEVKPLLLKVAGNDEERLEIRGQASLALCDLALLYTAILTPYDVENVTFSFADIIKSMLDHSKPAVVAVAAEVSAKLLFAGKLHDSYLLAQLLVVFFRSDFIDVTVDNGDERVQEVGSVVRLQQLLTVFFPAYSIKSQEGRETLLGSIKSVIAIVNDKQSKKKKTSASMSWPIVKIIEYVCSTVDIGAQQDVVKSPVDSEDCTEKSEENMEDSQEEESVHTTSSVLSASIAISDFIIKAGTDISTVYVRALCKFLGGAHIDVQSDNEVRLSLLKKNMNELELLVTDASSSRAVQKLNDALSTVDSEDEDEDRTTTSESDEDSLAGAMEAIALSEASEGKENAARSEAVPGNGKGIVSRTKRRLTQVNYFEEE